MKRTLAKKGSKFVYGRKQPTNNVGVTIVASTTANGDKLPILIILPGEQDAILEVKINRWSYVEENDDLLVCCTPSSYNNEYGMRTHEMRKFIGHGLKETKA